MHQLTLVLIGGTGAGKSSVGSSLERDHGWTWNDVDAAVERSVGMSIEQLIRVEGEQRFRAEECKALSAALSAKVSGNLVITTGAGAVAHEASKELLLRGVQSERIKIVWLDCSAEECAKRTLADELSARAKGQSNLRPMLALGDKAELAGTIGTDIWETESKKLLLNLSDKIRELSQKRNTGYREVANFVLWTEFVGAQKIASTIVELMTTNIQAEAKMFVSPQLLLGDSEATVIEGKNSRQVLPTLLAKMKGSSRVALVYDSALPTTLVKAVSDAVGSEKQQLAIALPNGESAKCLTVVQSVSEKLAAEGFSRKDPIIAIGGGVAGDVTGLIASLYMRGVPLIQVTTTIVGAVDSAIGGKTAVNLASGKNMVGTFYPASTVIIDPELIRSLPEREYVSGLAEVIKYGVMFSDQFLSWLENNIPGIEQRNEQVLSDIIRFCVTCKQRVVGVDLNDTLGQRALLNFGHTFGHALENLLAYRGILHGEAVAIGMMIAFKISAGLRLKNKEDLKEITELQQRVARLLQNCGLPIAISELAGEKFLRKIAGSLGSGALEADAKERANLVAEVPRLIEKSAGERWKNALVSDKKRTSGGIDFVGVKKAGEPFIQPLLVDELFSLSGIV